MEVRIINILLQWAKDMKLGRRGLGFKLGSAWPHHGHLSSSVPSPRNSALLGGLVSSVPYAFLPTHYKDRVCY